jgi:hypothetical protein
MERANPPTLEKDCDAGLGRADVTLCMHGPRSGINPPQPPLSAAAAFG